MNPHNDPFSVESVTRDAVHIGSYVAYLPHATYPIHIAGLGGRSVATATEIRDQLTAAIDLAQQDRS